MQKDYNTAQSFEKEGLDDIFGIRLNAISEQHLRTISVWAIISGILGFLVLGVGIMGMYKSFILIFTYGLQSDTFFVLVGGLIYVSLNIFLNIFLLRTGMLLKKTLANRSQAQLGQALLALRNYMRSLGAYLIVFVFIVLFVFVFSFAAIMR